MRSQSRGSRLRKGLRVQADDLTKVERLLSKNFFKIFQDFRLYHFWLKLASKIRER